jgi:hypothetical protein
MHQLSTNLVLPWPDHMLRLVDQFPPPTPNGLFQHCGVALGEDIGCGGVLHGRLTDLGGYDMWWPHGRPDALRGSMDLVCYWISCFCPVEDDGQVVCHGYPDASFSGLWQGLGWATTSWQSRPPTQWKQLEPGCASVVAVMAKAHR